MTTESDDSVKTLERVAQELQTRIGQITSNYETQMAVLKAQAQGEIEKRDSQIQELAEEIINLRNDQSAAVEAE
jgi:glucose-6-phosphate-specific signal transduction histidine kinase